MEGTISTLSGDIDFLMEGTISTLSGDIEFLMEGCESWPGQSFF